jgi:hypothetical protein
VQVNGVDSLGIASAAMWDNLLKALVTSSTVSRRRVTLDKK